MGSYVKVGSEGDVAPGTVKCVRTGDRRIALFNERGTLVAYDDACTHVGGPLSEGSCEDGTITCLWHGAKFRIADGEPLTPPAGGKLRSYCVRVRAGAIEIEIDE
jgi:nitrite reductase/ring-hydroxylating ferredoxin subunit